MKQVQQGIIHIADISGYTAFLNESELEHAQESLQSLIEVLIENTKLPLVISRLEGDAVISYAVDGSFLQGASVLEMIESSYITFRKALDLMVVNTTCTCNACRNIPNLDLKFFIHHGSFALQQLPAYTELVGSDVNTAHRLTKNHVREGTGFNAYALFTRAAIEAHRVADLLSEPGAALGGDAGGDGASSHPSGLEDEHGPAARHTAVEEGWWNPGRLSRPWRRDDDARARASAVVDDFGERLVDRQRLHGGLGCMGACGSVQTPWRTRGFAQIVADSLTVSKGSGRFMDTPVVRPMSGARVCWWRG